MLSDWAGWLITLSLIGIYVIIMGYGESTMKIETSVNSVYLHPDQLDYEYTAPGEGNRVAIYFTDVDNYTFNDIWLTKEEARTLRDQLSEHIKESE